MKRVQKRGIEVAAVRRLLLERPGVVQGRSYGMPSFLLHGRFLARFRDDDTVLVLQLATIGERDVLMELDERSFFFTDHYRNYPAVLVRLAGVSLPDTVYVGLFVCSHNATVTERAIFSKVRIGTAPKRN